MQDNPVRYSDPTGHRCEPEDDCGGSRHTLADRIYNWKWRIKNKFDVTMSDDGDKDWDAKNLSLMYSSLQNIDVSLNGTLNTLIGGATFKLSNYQGDKDYSGWTTHDKTITFYTKGTSAIRQMNIYHEFGHLIDSLPGKMFDVFTNALKTQDSPSFIGNNGYLNENALIDTRVTSDLNYASVQAIQASDNTSSEQWADIFANFVAGNIDLSKPAGPGRDMYDFITGVLGPYINNPPGSR